MDQAEAKRIIDLVKLVSGFEEANKQRDTFAQNIAVLSESILYGAIPQLPHPFPQLADGSYQVGQHKILVFDDRRYRVDSISVQVISDGYNRVGGGIPVRVLDESTCMIWDSYFDSEGKRLKK